MGKVEIMKIGLSFCCGTGSPVRAPARTARITAILVAIFVLVGAAAAACLARDLRRIQMMQRVNMRKNKIATSGVVVAIIIPVLSDDELDSAQQSVSQQLV